MTIVRKRFLKSVGTSFTVTSKMNCRLLLCKSRQFILLDTVYSAQQQEDKTKLMHQLKINNLNKLGLGQLAIS